MACCGLPAFLAHVWDWGLSVFGAAYSACGFILGSRTQGCSRMPDPVHVFRDSSAPVATSTYGLRESPLAPISTVLGRKFGNS